jgi:hypothetical protein
LKRKTYPGRQRTDIDNQPSALPAHVGQGGRQGPGDRRPH